jgi:carbohydrate binding protein with CBM4/9 domain
VSRPSDSVGHPSSTISWILSVLLAASFLALFPSRGYADASNLVGNPSFESSIVSGCCPQTTGNWEAYSLSGNLPVEESAVVHSGPQALQVKTPAGASGGAGYQDFPSFPSNTNYTFSFWVEPMFGDQQMSLLFGWDRGGRGTVLGESSVIIYPDHILVSAWGQTATITTTTNQYYGSWHQFHPGSGCIELDQ